jgi:hypothetical protein
MDGRDEPKVDLLQLVRGWLCDELNGQWTMIVDNADDEAIFFDHTTQNHTTGGLKQPAELLSDYLPQSPNGSILITSRSQAVAHKLTGIHSNIIEVKPLDEDDALSLLDKKLGSAADRNGAVRLVHALDSMPLAITQAAAFIQQRGPRMSVSKYVDEICRSDQDRARLLEKDVGDSRRDGRASNSIIATWQILFEYIRKHMPTAARLLSLMSMFDRQNIPVLLLQIYYESDKGGDADLDDDIYTLSSFSLVKISADGGELEMHQLVQFSTKKWLELYGELEVWRKTYATLVDAMRLLHFDALGKLVMTTFHGKTIPPYAILSHRWSDSEIMFEDICYGTYKDKQEGYRKLEFCAKQAVQDNLQYFWIDTCCIDKWNLRETSKAINSMYQWYKNAARCYVFMSDVSVSTATEPVQRTDWEASFRASAWFTRGWTLQELIAPVTVKFFSCEGRHIGNKTSLDQLIHEITNIPLAALRNCPLNEFSTTERGRWAKHRSTKEEEDIVYCLLGILGISMPIAYGEGQESARRRLQIEVEAAGSTPSIMPFSRDADDEDSAWRRAS